MILVFTVLVAATDLEISPITPIAGPQSKSAAEPTSPHPPRQPLSQGRSGDTNHEVFKPTDSKRVGESANRLATYGTGAFSREGRYLLCSVCFWFLMCVGRRPSRFPMHRLRRAFGEGVASIGQPRLPRCRNATSLAEGSSKEIHVGPETREATSPCSLQDPGFVRSEFNPIPSASAHPSNVTIQSLFLESSFVNVDLAIAQRIRGRDTIAPAIVL